MIWRDNDKNSITTLSPPLNQNCFGYRIHDDRMHFAMKEAGEM